MLRITAYRTSECKNWDVHYTDKITAQDDNPEDARWSCENDHMPLLTFKDEDGKYMCLPIYFVISIEEVK